MRAALGVSTLLVLVVASCSLGLDETKIGDGVATGLPDRSGDGGATDALADSVAPASVVQTCAADADCTATNGCTKGTCDLARKACVYDVCRAAACSASACNLDTKTCAAATPYPYRATQFSLGAQVSCGNCAAAIYPWLFVVLTTGLTAFNVANPANPTPAQVPIVGLGFVPSQLVVSGSRLFMLGGQTGPGPSRVNVAYLDVPSDPFATKLSAVSVLATDDRPAEGIALFSYASGKALFVGPSTTSYPSAVLTPPLVEPLSIVTTLLVPVPGTAAVATSGTRLLMSGITGGLATFNFIDQPGTAAPQNQATVTINDAGQVSVARRWAQSATGAIFWMTNVHQGVDPGVTTRASRGYFLVPDAAGAIATTPGVDIEVYDVPQQGVGANVSTIAPLAMLDGTTAILAAQARENAAQTSVQFVKQNPLGLVKQADNVTTRRAVLPVSFATFAAAAGSNGIGYLVANDQVGPPANATAYVFDPACAP